MALKDSIYEVNMNIFDMFKELGKDDTKVFINGYNRVQAGFDSYELLFTDAEGNEMTVLMSNWREAKEDWIPRDKR